MRTDRRVPKFLTNAIKAAYTCDTVVVDRDRRLHSRRSNTCTEFILARELNAPVFFFHSFPQSLYYSHIVSTAAATITRRVKKGHVGFIVFLSHAYYVSLCVRQYNSVHCAHTRYSIRMYAVGSR